ncbi:hypothetical protein [Planctomicrobium piriforme]|nr:hypothetical protein [Planctomicrobium piriforme]
MLRGTERFALRRFRHMGKVAIVAAGLCLLTCGCGTGLFGSQGGTVQVLEVIASPLPPLKPDSSVTRPDRQILWGRVVIDGRPAKKDEVRVLASSAQAVTEAEGDANRLVPRRITPKTKPLQKQLSTSVAQDDGLYMIKEMLPGATYILYFEFGPAYADKQAATEIYQTPFDSQFIVKMKKGPTMMDLVLQIDTAAAGKK